MDRVEFWRRQSTLSRIRTALVPRSQRIQRRPWGGNRGRHRRKGTKVARLQSADRRGVDTGTKRRQDTPTMHYKQILVTGTKIMNGKEFSIAWTNVLESRARRHLLAHIERGIRQEDIALATWYPAEGKTRYTAIIHEVHLPHHDERKLQGNVQLTPKYIRRVRDKARAKGAGLLVMHNHFTPGWQGMSRDDVEMERDSLRGPAKATGLPLVGMTIGIDGAWSGRIWNRERRDVARKWCESVRIVGSEGIEIQRNPDRREISPDGRDKEKVRYMRTVEALGSYGHEALANLRVAIVGLGSVGALVAEGLMRMGVRKLTLVDPDRVEEHNLDRMIHTDRWDIGRYKVDTTASALERSRGDKLLEVEVYRTSLAVEKSFRATADSDVILGCVDKPVGRDLLNHLAVCHLIPVIEGGVRLEARESRLNRGQVSARVVHPEAECLRCARQYSTDDVTLEKEGLLEDPQYLMASANSVGEPRANTFAASMTAAAEQLNLLVRITAGARWWPRVSEVRHDLKFNHAKASARECRIGCDMRKKACGGSKEEPKWLLEAD